LHRHIIVAPEVTLAWAKGLLAFFREEDMLRHRLPVALTALLVLILLANCGSAPEPAAVVERADAVEKEVVVEKQAVEGEAEKHVQATAAPEPPPAGVSALASLSVPRSQRMIIKDADLELLVSDTDIALDSVTVIVVDYGGYIISTHTWYEDDFRYATVRLGVPVEEFENVLRRLRGLALQVLSEIASGEDVTDQYVDLQSRLTNLQATRDRIREFLDKAETVEEALQVNAQLSQVEGQIEEIQGRMNYLKDRAAYSTIDIQLNPERPTPTPSPTPTVTPTPTPVPWLPGETFQGATGVLTSIMKGLVNLGIWTLVVLGPFLAAIALVIGLVVVWRRRRARQAPPPEPPEPDDSPQ
jgi:hypothetical protein